MILFGGLCAIACAATLATPAQSVASLSQQEQRAAEAARREADAQQTTSAETAEPVVTISGQAQRAAEAAHREADARQARNDENN